jgi:mannosyltransferase
MRRFRLRRIERTRLVNPAMNTPDSLLSMDPEVIVFNLKQRYTGVSATINALVPLQAKQWRLGFCGTRMSNGIDGMTLAQAIALSRKPPAGRPFRIWHVRRDPEMMAAIFARDVLRLPIKLVFTSAAQHLHGRFPRWLISKMDAVISTTSLAASFVPNTTAVVPHGIDLSRFSPPPDKLTAWADSGLPGQYGIGVFGRVRPDKGSDVFVHAMIQALPQLPGATAVIAGLAQAQHQAYQQDLQRQIDEAGLHDRIVFLGEVPAGDVHRWYQRCLLCVACPRYEPFGLTPFEAAATGCALVCSKTGAFDQLAVPGQTGEMVETDDVQGLAQAVLSVLRDPQHAVQMGEAARARVTEHFSLAREAEGIGRVYQQLFDKASA